MSQGPLLAFVAQNPSNAPKPLNVDSSGNLIVTSASGGDAVTIADGADVTQGTKADAPWSSGSGSLVAILKQIANKNSLPAGATQITAASGSVAATAAVATLAGTSGKTTWITGFTVTAGGATSGLSVSLAITGTIGGTLTYVYTAPAGATVPAPPLDVEFKTPIQASAAATAIVVTLPSLGTGNLAAAVVATGYQV